MVESPLVRIGLRVFSGAVLASLYLPLVILGIYAFNPARSMAWPPTGITFHWFQEAIANPRIIDAFWASVFAGLGATAIALVLGTLAGRTRGWGTTVSPLWAAAILAAGMGFAVAAVASYVVTGVEDWLWAAVPVSLAAGLLLYAIGRATSRRAR